MKIAIVGGGVSLLEHEHGEEIDSHDRVYRFGGSEEVTASGIYEKQVGIKTTHWVANWNKQVVQKVERLTEEGFYTPDHTIVFAEVFWPKALKRIQNLKLKIRTRNKLLRKNIPFRNILLNEANIIARKLGYPKVTGQRCMTTGLNLVINMLGKYEYIKLFGFDIAKGIKTGHFYDKEKLIGPAHTASTERAIFQRILNDKETTKTEVVIA